MASFLGGGRGSVGRDIGMGILGLLASGGYAAYESGLLDKFLPKGKDPVASS
jgi:hypothetical protein